MQPTAMDMITDTAMITGMATITGTAMGTSQLPIPTPSPLITTSAFGKFLNPCQAIFESEPHGLWISALLSLQPMGLAGVERDDIAVFTLMKDGQGA